MAYVTGFPNKKVAQSFEWYTKKNRNKYSAKKDKLSKFCATLSLPKFNFLGLKLHVNPKYMLPKKV